MRQLSAPDRVGLGWRKELAAGVFEHLDELDVVEVIVDDYFSAPKKALGALRTLARQVPVVYHGVTLGLASTIEVDRGRLAKLARTLDELGAEDWSEHLAFVRAGGHEIGHLAAPPRCAETVDGALRNLERVRREVGSLPALENVATLIDPPGSTMAEPEWVGAIAAGADARLLLDLHNLYANALNFGHDPLAMLREFPLERVSTVHLSGGHWIGSPRRLLDDHVHDPPDAVYELLVELARRASGPLTVVIERDGAYPEFKALVGQVRRAREALGKGRDDSAL